MNCWYAEDLSHKLQEFTRREDATIRCHKIVGIETSVLYAGVSPIKSCWARQLRGRRAVGNKLQSGEHIAFPTIQTFHLPLNVLVLN